MSIIKCVFHFYDNAQLIKEVMLMDSYDDLFRKITDLLSYDDNLILCKVTITFLGKGYFSNSDLFQYILGMTDEEKFKYRGHLIQTERVIFDIEGKSVAF